MSDMVDFIVTMRNTDTDDTVETTVGIPSDRMIGSGCSAIMSVAEEVVAAAVENVAERLGEPLTVDEIIKAGETKRFLISGAYPGNGGPFSDSVEAVDAGDAEFRIRWAMTLEREVDLDDVSQFESFLDSMLDNSIYDVDDLPVSKEESNNAFVTLYRAIETGEGLEEARVRAGEVLLALGLIEEATTSPAMR